MYIYRYRYVLAVDAGHTFVVTQLLEIYCEQTMVLQPVIATLPEPDRTKQYASCKAFVDFHSEDKKLDSDGTYQRRRGVLRRTNPVTGASINYNDPHTGDSKINQKIGYAKYKYYEHTKMLMNYRINLNT